MFEIVVEYSQGSLERQTPDQRTTMKALVYAESPVTEEEIFKHVRAGNIWRQDFKIVKIEHGEFWVPNERP